MADRQLKITIRAEMQKGFADLSKSLNSLNASLKSLNGLQTSLNNLTNQFDKSNRFREAVAETSKLAKNTREINAAIGKGVTIARQNASAQDQMLDKLNKVNAAEKAGKVSAEQRLNTEIALTKKLIKETNDFSILQAKRDSKGRFVPGAISATARKNLSAQYAGQALSGLSGAFNKMPQAYGPPTSIYTDYAAERKKWDTIDATLQRRNQRFQDAFNRSVAPSGPSRGRGYMPSSSGGSSGGSGGILVPMGGDPTGGRGIKLPSTKDLAVGRSLVDTYTKLGRALFLLQYSTMTIFGATGIGLITAQVDKYITLKNQVARTSDSVKDLGANMKAVFTIANNTFSDVSATGQLFSTINKYSKTLGINKEQVAGVTQAISGAYAASPGTAEAKNAAQYQLIQAITSNRLGGDELRSQLEQAPVVVDILQRYLGKVRGKPGETLDLRDKKNPINTKEIISIFSDPQAQKELRNLQQRQVRTFSDVIQVAKNKIVEYSGKFEESTGLFRSMNQALVAFLNGDGLPRLIKTIGQVTTALIIFGTTLLAQSAVQSVGKIGSGIKGLGEYGAAVKSYRGYKAAQAADIGRDVFSAGGMVATSQLERQAAVLASKEAAVIAAASKLEGPFAKLAPLLLGTGEAAAGLGTALTAWTIIIPILIAIVAGLIIRFNELLKTFGDGINIIDVLKGTFQQLTKSFLDFMDKITPQWFDTMLGAVGRFFHGLMGWIDRLLMRGVDGAKENQYVQKSALTRNFNLTQADVYGSKAQLATVSGYSADGKLLSGTAKQRFSGPQGGNVWDKNEKGELAVYNNGKLAGYINKDGGMPSGMKGELPRPAAVKTPHVPKTPAQRMQDRVDELIRDLKLQASDSTSDRKVSDQMKDIVKSTASNIKKAADTLDINSYDKLSGKFLDDAQLLKKISEKNAELGKVLGEVNTSLSNDKLSEALRDFSNNVNGIINASDTLRNQKRMTSVGIADDNAMSDLLEKVLNNPAFSSLDDAGKQKYRNLAATRGAGSALQDFANDPLTTNVSILSEAINSLEKSMQDERDWNKNWINGLQSALIGYYDEVSNTAQVWSGVFTNALTGLEQSLTNWISGGKFGGKELARNTVKDIAGAFVKTKIMSPILGALGIGELGTKQNPMYVKMVNGVQDILGNLSDDDGASGLFKKGLDGIKNSGVGKSIGKLFNAGKEGASNTGGWLSTAATILSNIFHTGGVVGESSATRMVNANVFANARRYHTGGIAGMPALAANEVPAILQRGERVLTAQQQQSMSRSSGHTAVYSPNIEINYTAGQGSNTSEADAAQMAQQFRDASQIQFQQFLLKEMKQGGMLSR